MLDENLNTLLEISDKMATVCLVICIRLIRNDFHFHEKKHRTQTFFQKLQKAGSSGTVGRPLDEQTSQFLTFWFLTYLYRSGIFKVHKIIFKTYRVVCQLGEAETLLDLPRCFERIQVKQSKVYVVIGVTDVKDDISNCNNIT